MQVSVGSEVLSQPCIMIRLSTARHGVVLFLLLRAVMTTPEGMLSHDGPIEYLFAFEAASIDGQVVVSQRAYGRHDLHLTICQVQGCPPAHRPS